VTEKLQEETKISVKDLRIKIQKLEGYIRRAERRLSAHEKKLAKLREELKAEIKILKERLIA